MSGVQQTSWVAAPRPWSFTFHLGRATVVDADGRPVAFVDSTRGKFEPEKVNAERIVHCVNLHDELVRQLRDICALADRNVRFTDDGKPCRTAEAQAMYDEAVALIAKARSTA